MKKKVLVEGWRGINHSYAMVNQHQLLQLKKSDRLQLFHRDLPFYNPAWSVQTNANGFSAAQNAQLRDIAAPGAEPPDITYRIAFPYRHYGSDSARLLCFGTAEYQNIDGFLYEGPENGRAFPQRTVEIVTPSEWSRVGFLRHGFDAAAVRVVPHGVDTALYQPMQPAARAQARKGLGLPDDSFVFLSVGAMTWNKGIDKLLRAFAIVNRKYPSTVLALKDQSNLYGINANDLVIEARNAHPAEFTDAVLARIAVMSINLTVEQLKILYNACDAYVSPYRAEGFNLPPLEAAACGKPIVVTAGGATDDYCHPSFASRIAGKAMVDGNKRYLEPDLDSLVEAMLALVEGRTALDPAAASRHIAANFSWERATERLVDIFCER
jgi:glycosyltransferase involved in cell wall biosynthesis